MKNSWHWIAVDQAEPPIHQTVLVDTNDPSVGYQTAFLDLDQADRTFWRWLLTGKAVSLHKPVYSDSVRVIYWTPIFGPDGEYPEWWNDDQAE